MPMHQAVETLSGGFSITKAIRLYSTHRNVAAGVAVLSLWRSAVYSVTHCAQTPVSLLIVDTARASRGDWQRGSISMHGPILIKRVLPVSIPLCHYFPCHSSAYVCREWL